MLNRKMKPIAAAVGAAFAASLAPSAAADAANLEVAAADPFETRALDGVLFATKHKEGGCGEDKPAEGDDKAEGECGEGKCGEDHEEGEGDADADSEEAESGDAEEES